MADISKLNFGNGGGSNDIKDAKAFRTDDAAETAIADEDYFPFYDTSASTKKKSLWSNVVNVLKKTFAIKDHRATGTTYGVGTSSYYGHNKVIDTLNKTSLTNGESLSAHMGNTIGKMLCQVETGTTYSTDYDVAGLYFIWNDDLYVTTTPSYAGTTITSGGNCELVSSLSKQWNGGAGIANFATNMKQGNITLKSGNTKSSEMDAAVYKAGNMCACTCGIVNSSNTFYINANSATVVATIPEPFRPRSNTIIPVLCQIGSYWRLNEVMVRYNGDIYLRERNGNSGYLKYLYFSCSYYSWF